MLGCVGMALLAGKFLSGEPLSINLLYVFLSNIGICPRNILKCKTSGDIPLPEYRRLPHALSPNRRTQVTHGGAVLTFHKAKRTFRAKVFF